MSRSSKLATGAAHAGKHPPTSPLGASQAAHLPRGCGAGTLISVRLHGRRAHRHDCGAAARARPGTLPGATLVCHDSQPHPEPDQLAHGATCSGTR